MDDIIEKLYHLHLSDCSAPLGCPDRENMKEEWELYSYLYTNLPKEYKELFSKYANLRSTRESEEYKAIFEHGFKTAIQLIIESLK